MLIVYLLGTIILFNCAYYLLFSKFSFSKVIERKAAVHYPVSVLVCSKNEAENLKAHIPLWLEQEYEDFELILINDASTDDTLEVMEQFAQGDPRIAIVDVATNETFWGSKKYALTLGIKKAKHKRLLFTDADCKPASKHWISQMVSQLDERKQIILGYGAYQKMPGLLNAIIRFETILTATQYFSYAMAGNPYMGVGRNIAYTSNIFYENSGFTSHMNIQSGDDDLFVNKAATPSNTGLQFHPDSFTYSIPKTTFREWLLQKKRHTTTAKFYKFKHKFLLSAFFFFNLSFWILTMIGCLGSYWKLVVPMICFRFLFQMLILGKVAAKLKERPLIIFIPILELFLVFLQLVIFSSKRTSSHANWK
ncbi:glycosyltransferase [Aureitalea sp. L0-47]|uniref:glycosyltransferase n=1 Tax=Aureitalea sp. L0-47 TaxID=2816962 RepID=UPI002238BBAA|nr:glycosyltransferase [Aureitalea sp. L0-47]MCW5519316.1 glycosyltransferase [Aureitalea sp. L0-47]